MSFNSQVPVAEFLIKEFREVAKQQLDKPTQHFSPGCESEAYDKHLKSLRLVGLADSVTIFRALWAWRCPLQKSVTQLDGRKVVLDTIYLEATLQLVEDKEWLCSDVLGDCTGSVESLTFEWILKFDHYIPQADKNDPYRSYVTNILGRLVRSLAWGRLEVISAIFFKELKLRIESESHAPLQEIVWLLTAMRGIQLSFDSDNDMAAAVNFLDHADPLKHVAQHKKSQVQHALAQMLSHILQPLIANDIPRSLPGCSREHLAQWYSEVSSIRLGVLEWSQRKTKHIQSGYPLIVDLWCLEDDDRFYRHGEKVMKVMVKALKQKETKILGVRCLIQCLHEWLYRQSQRGDNHRIVEDTLFRIAKSVISSAKKGMNGSSELKDLIVMLCATVGEYEPKIAMERIVYEFLQNDHWECVTLGLRGLMELVLIGAKDKDKDKGGPRNQTKALLQRSRSQLVTLETHELEVKLLNYISTGHHVLELLKLEGCVGRLSRDLRKIFVNCVTLLGSVASLTRGSTGDSAKDAQGGLHVLSWCLRVIPYLLPEDWHNGPKLADILPQYTSHSEVLVCGVAFRTVRNVLVGIPAHRNALIVGMLRFVLNLGDDSVQAIVDCLRNLILLLKDWHSIETSPVCQSTSTYAELDIHRLEGAGLCLLTSPECDIKTLAIELLIQGSELHRVMRCRQAESLPSSLIQDNGTPKTQLIQDAGWNDIQGLKPGEQELYVSDVLKEMGQEIVLRCYWDFGEWSDLMRRWRPVPETVTLMDMLRCTGEQSTAAIRWARCLSEIAKEASLLCQSSVLQAYVFVSKKIRKLMRHDSAGRQTIPVDVNDQKTLDAWRNYTSFACGCPPHKKTGSQSEEIVATAVLFQALLSPLYVQSMHHYQGSSIMSLGNCNPDCYEVLAIQLKALFDIFEERTSSKHKAKYRTEEVRLNVANILRIVADSMPRGILNHKQTMRRRLFSFLECTVSYLRLIAPVGIYEYICSSAPDNLADVHQLCYCLCIVAANVGPDWVRYHREELRIDLRRTLFVMFSQWCSPGSPPGDYERDMERLKTVLISRKTWNFDTESRTRVYDDLYRSCAQLAHAARMAMVAMLQGSLFDSDKRLTGPVFIWIDHLLTSGTGGGNPFGPSKQSIARQALVKLLLSNLFLFDSYFDKCYNNVPEVAAVYFQAVSEVFCSCELNCPIQNILSLVLYKCVDSKPEVREDAFHVLRVLAMREWQDKSLADWSMGFSEDAESDIVVVGSLQDSCHHFQYQLSEILAREHPEVNENICVELMTRQLVGVNQGVLVCLTPWMERVSFSPGDCGWGDRLLKSMYYVTHQHGSHYSYEIEKMWSTVAGNPRNVRPILDFLVSFGVKECAVQEVEALLQYFSVLKRISLYLARACPNQTIDQLVSESSQMIQALDHVGVDVGNSQMPFAVRFSEVSSRSETQTPELGTGDGSREMARTGSRHMRSRRESREVGSIVHVSSLSMHSDGSIEGSQMSTKSDNLKRSPSNMSALGSERRGSEVIAPSLKGLLQRSELSICLLSELAFEQGEKFTEHVPLLLHICVICMDSPEPVVRLHCQELIMNLLRALAKKKRLAGLVENVQEKLSSLINYVKSMKGLPLWPYEDVDLLDGRLLSEDSLRKFVLSLRDHVDQSILDRWTEEALSWAVESRSRHLSCRSIQVLRALCPNPSSELVINLLCCLRECFKAPATTSMECVLEIMDLLEVLMFRVEPSKLVLYPQLYWISVVLLSSDFVHLHYSAAKLLHLGLSSLDMGNETTLNILLATTPGINGTAVIQNQGHESLKSETHSLPFLIMTPRMPPVEPDPSQLHIACIQQLLLKGLQTAKTESITVHLLALLVRHLGQPSDHFSPLDSTCFGLSDSPGNDPFRKGVSALLGGIGLQIVVTIVAIVPWAILQNGAGKNRDLVGEVCGALAEACSAEGWTILAMVLNVLGSAAQGGIIPILPELSRGVCRELPNWFLSLALGYWLGLVQSRDTSRAGVGLLLLGSVFEQCRQFAQTQPGRTGFPVVMSFAADAHAFSVISAHLQTTLRKDAQEVISTMVACSNGLGQDRTPLRNNVELAEAMHMGINLHKHVLTTPDQVHMAINGILETCPMHSRESSKRIFMPFIQELLRSS